MTPSLRRKICSRVSLQRAVQRAQRQGKRIVFTNGCFDLLHVGHVTLLERAKRLGDVFIVAINSDRSIRALRKGPGRPLVPQHHRATVLAALASVDFVTIFDEPTPFKLIRQLKPDVLVKGADWASTGIVGSDLIRRSGGRVVRLPLVKGFSTTALVKRLRRLSS